MSPYWFQDLNELLSIHNFFLIILFAPMNDKQINFSSILSIWNGNIFQWQNGSIVKSGFKITKFWRFGLLFKKVHKATKSMKSGRLFSFTKVQKGTVQLNDKMYTMKLHFHLHLMLELRRKGIVHIVWWLTETKDTSITWMGLS
jgi:hypothetical protein